MVRLPHLLLAYADSEWYAVAVLLSYTTLKLMSMLQLCATYKWLNTPSSLADTTFHRHTAGVLELVANLPVQQQ